MNLLNEAAANRFWTSVLMEPPISEDAGKYVCACTYKYTHMHVFLCTFVCVFVDVCVAGATHS